MLDILVRNRQKLSDKSIITSIRYIKGIFISSTDNTDNLPLNTENKDGRNALVSRSFTINTESLHQPTYQRIITAKPLSLTEKVEQQEVEKTIVSVFNNSRDVFDESEYFPLTLNTS